jgi:hypothetical protein
MNDVLDLLNDDLSLQRVSSCANVPGQLDSGMLQVPCRFSGFLFASALASRIDMPVHATKITAIVSAAAGAMNFYNSIQISNAVGRPEGLLTRG